MSKTGFAGRAQGGLRYGRKVYLYLRTLILRESGSFMLKHRIGHTLFATVALAVSFSAVGVSSALAKRSGTFEVFQQCPVSNENLAGCLVSRTEGGEITIGKQGVPIVATQTLQGGFEENSEGALTFVGAANGETFSKTPQKVPGGLLGIKCAEIKGEGWFEKGLRGTCEYLFEHGLTEVKATTELSAPASSIGLNETNLLIESGTALSLPVKVKLENTLFGGECYVGPITLNLTSGTSGSLKGRLGLPSSRAEGRILVINFNTLVDSGFSAPKATGCGIFGLLDGIINEKIGLPASTTDAATLDNTIEQATAGVVRRNLKREEEEE
jgi:hypothetical protein